MLRSIIFLVSVWFASYPSFGQVSGFIWHQVGVEDGLSQATNAFVFKDTRGFIWISSISGLNRYDGTSVKVYMPDVKDPASLLGENIQSEFFEDSKGDIWFTTYDAINKYNWDQDCFDHYQLLDKEGKTRLGYYIFYKDPQEYLWLLVENHQLYTFHIPTGTTDFKGVANTNTIRCIPIVDPAGNPIKILMRGRDWPGLQIVDISAEGKFSMPYSISPLANFQSTNIKAMKADSDSAAWVLSNSALFHYSFLRDHVASYLLSGGECMINLNDSILLIGTLNTGLITFNMHTRMFSSLPDNASPRSPSGRLQKINYMSKDRDGNIWISVDGVGLHYSLPGKNKFDFIKFDDYLQGTTEVNPVKMYEEQPGKILCFTTYNGVLEINLDQQEVGIKPFAPLNALKSHKIKTVTRDVMGRYWIGTWLGVFVFLPSTMELIQVTDASNLGLSSAASSNGRVYYTTSLTGLCEAYMEADLKPIYSALKAVPKDEVYLSVLLDHKNRIWLNHELMEFKVFDPVTYALITTIPINGICNSMAVTADGKTIYIGSSTGLFEIDEANLKVRKFHTEQTGLPAVGINSILPDNHNHLWMAHSKGILKLDPHTGVIKSFGVEDGLPATEFTQANCKLNNGLLCFASINGIATFYPDSVKEIGIQAIPQITGLQINDKSPDFDIVCQTTGTTHFPLMENLTFNYKYNTLSFTINSLEYSAPESNTLLYSMEELDEGYIIAKNGSRIRYPNLQPGSYRFVLYARNSDGVQNPNPRILRITIKPPYYKTWWFRILAAFSVFSIVAYIIYLRFSKKLELQNIRLKLYENLHDDVGSRLTAIVLSAEELERTEHMAHPKLKSISKIARSIVGNMRRLVWAIDPENDKMNSILQKINHDKSLILDDAIYLAIEIDPSLKNLIVPGEIRYQMSSICNEAFNNISKYAEASNVRIIVTKEKNTLKMVIEDNGIGFDTKAQSRDQLAGSGYGLANMQRRASRVGGQFMISSTPGAGTRIEVRFPFS